MVAYQATRQGQVRLRVPAAVCAAVLGSAPLTARWLSAGATETRATATMATVSALSVLLNSILHYVLTCTRQIGLRGFARLPDKCLQDPLTNACKTPLRVHVSTPCKKFLQGPLTKINCISSPHFKTIFFYGIFLKIFLNSVHKIKKNVYKVIKS